jgi:hypothetical protein
LLRRWQERIAYERFPDLLLRAVPAPFDPEPATRLDDAIQEATAIGVKALLDSFVGPKA